MSRVSFFADELVIDGEARVLVGAPFSPVRVPRSQWREHLEAIAALGFTIVDVELPWSEMERSPGESTFEGPCDIGEFFDLVQDSGLLVLLRLGPYVGARWSRGGLPIWLDVAGDVGLRWDESVYLSHVKRWFRALLPVVVEHLIDRGGPIVLIQIEHELDRSAYSDPTTYIDALHEMATAGGVSVPVIASAGQGDLDRAAGRSGDIAPAVNFWNFDGGADLERGLSYYGSATRERGLPLLIPDSGHAGRTLKRLVVGGARLVGLPRRHRATGSEGRDPGDEPLYSGGQQEMSGFIDLRGASRPEAAELLRLNSTVAALGERLSKSIPLGMIEGVDHDFEIEPSGAQLHGGGEILALTTLGSPGAAVLRTRGSPLFIPVATDMSVLILRDVPIAGVLLSASVELLSIIETAPADRLNHDPVADLTFESRGCVAEVVLAGRNILSRALYGDVTVEASPDVMRIAGSSGAAVIETSKGALRVKIHPSAAGQGSGNSVKHVLRRMLAGAPASIATLQPQIWREVAKAGVARPLDSHGSLSGTGMYSVNDVSDTSHGVVLRCPIGMIQFRSPSTASTWTSADGADLWYPWDGAPRADRFDIVARPSGYAYPDAAITSPEAFQRGGVDGIMVVEDVVPFDHGWFLSAIDDQIIGQNPPPRVPFGRWTSAVLPAQVRYRRFIPSRLAGTGALHIRSGQCRVDVLIDGIQVGFMSPMRPVLWVGRLEVGAVIELVVHQMWGEEVGSIELLLGSETDQVLTSASDTAELVTGESVAEYAWSSFPLLTPAGKGRWVRIAAAPNPAGSSSNLTLSVVGSNIYVACLAGTTLIGNLLVNTEANPLRKSCVNTFVVPERLRDQPIALLIEAAGSNAGRLDYVVIGEDGEER